MTNALLKQGSGTSRNVVTEINFAWWRRMLVSLDAGVYLKLTGNGAALQN